MEMLEIYLADDERRLFEVSESFYIKRIYKDNEIEFECTNEPVIYYCNSKDEVSQWFDEQMAKRLNIPMDVVNYCNEQKAKK